MACPSPVTERSASFRLRFRFVRGEAAWVHDHRGPYRWASRVRVSGCARAAFRCIFGVICMVFNGFCCFLLVRACFL